ncbi:MAG: biotin--[acetyl-CoA-carboxylase] ligase [Clostridiales bacterium]|nr:biotin--[acetyl-CoA-carboxylase] ligase [Clostridiales bacterium]
MKNEILDILYKDIGNIVSGQELSRRLGVSRTAVWKHIKALSAEGYSIKSLGGKGYNLTQSDVLNEYELKKAIGEDIPFVFKKSIDSTNNLAKKIAAETESSFMFVISENQESGRGRLGRSFESANKKGIWCSFILKPDLAPESALIITVAAAGAVCKTIEEVCELKTGIKWPNDIIAGKKKICGILSEMSCGTGAIEYIVVGIGINILQTLNDFSAEVAEIATSVLLEAGRRCLRAEIISSLCYNMQEVYDLVKEGNNKEIVNRWKKYSVTDGKAIKIIKNGVITNVFTEGIDDIGRLIITDENGVKSEYNSGEISVRGIMGYI